MPDTAPVQPTTPGAQPAPPQINPPGSAAFMQQFSDILEKTTAEFMATMQAQTQAAIQNIRSAEAQGPSDIEIMLAIQQNPDLRKAVVTLMQAKKPV